MIYYVFLLAVSGMLYEGTEALSFVDPSPFEEFLLENSPIGLTFTQGKCDVTGATNPVQYSLVGDDGKFDVPASGNAVLIGQLDFETKSQYTVQITATSGVDTTATPKIMTVNVENVEPKFDSGASTTVLNMDPCDAKEVGNFTANDPGHSPVRYSIETGHDASLFKIDNMTGKMASVRKLAVTTTYQVVIHAVDTANPPATGSTTVTVKTEDNACDTAAAIVISTTLQYIVLFVSFFLK